jgi:hypothetical protein
MALNRLADPTVATTELHRALDLESSWVGSVARNGNENGPLLVRGDARIYYLRARKR